MGCKISGQLFFEGSTEIQGQVDGELSAKDVLVIGRNGIVSGHIKAASIVIRGKVDADITARRIEIGPSGKVSGTLASTVLVIAEGAMFEGCSTMQPDGVTAGANLTQVAN